jgi:hypothetical protein
MVYILERVFIAFIVKTFYSTGAKFKRSAIFTGNLIARKLQAGQ